MRDAIDSSREAKDNKVAESLIPGALINCRDLATCRPTDGPWSAGYLSLYLSGGVPLDLISPNSFDEVAPARAGPR